MRLLCCVAATGGLRRLRFQSRRGEETRARARNCRPRCAAGGAAGRTRRRRPRSATFGLDLSAGNPSVKPGDDFFAYANGTWDESFTIPADKSSFGPFDRLDELSKERVRDIIEQARPRRTPPAAPPSSRSATYYAAFMDEAAIEANGLAPGAAGSASASRAAKTRADIARLFGTIGFATLFDVQLTRGLQEPGPLRGLHQPVVARTARPRLLPEG